MRGEEDNGQELSCKLGGFNSAALQFGQTELRIKK